MCEETYESDDWDPYAEKMRLESLIESETLDPTSREYDRIIDRLITVESVISEMEYVSPLAADETRYLSDLI